MRCSQLHIGCGTTGHCEYFVCDCDYWEGKDARCEPPLEQHSFSEERAERHDNKTTPVQEACDRADPALTREQKSALVALINNHSEEFSASAKDFKRTNLIYQFAVIKNNIQLLLIIQQ